MFSVVFSTYTLGSDAHSHEYLFICKVQQGRTLKTSIGQTRANFDWQWWGGSSVCLRLGHQSL